MVEKDVKKALVCCRVNNCGLCPYADMYPCRKKLAIDTLLLLRRKDEEIEELKNGVNNND
jgi:hypothetical protein